MEFATIVWTVGIAAWVAFLVYVYWIAQQVWNDRLTRCPETGAVTLVGVEYASPRPGAAPVARVRRCRLWPERENCAQECLVRCDETLPGFPPRVNPLRPFERG